MGRSQNGTISDNVISLTAKMEKYCLYKLNSYRYRRETFPALGCLHMVFIAPIFEVNISLPVMLFH